MSTPSYTVWCLCSEKGDHVACFPTEEAALQYATENFEQCGHDYSITEEEFDVTCDCGNHHIPELEDQDEMDQTLENE